MKDAADLSYLQDLDFAVFRNRKHGFQEEMIKAQKARHIIENNMLFNGVFNMIPYAVYDLLHFSPSEIKVYHVNFFSSKKAYAENYYSKKRDCFRNYRMFAFHDCLTQLNFTRNILKAGLIDVDNNCASVLRMKNEDYMKRLEEIYKWIYLQNERK